MFLLIIFDYPGFLTSLKLYSFETISTIVILVLLIDFAIKELRPALKRIAEFCNAFNKKGHERI
jgi:uncharacterized protein with GYD domain